jgi:hypothetical protein
MPDPGEPRQPPAVPPDTEPAPASADSGSPPSAGSGPREVADSTGPAAVAERRRPRPVAVTIVAVTFLVVSLAWAALTLQALISAQILLPPGGGLVDTALLRSSIRPFSVTVAVRQGFVGVLAFLASVGLFQMRPRGWLLAMVAAVIVLAVQLVSWYDSAPNYPFMALAVAVVLLMNQAEVRDGFRGEAPA